MAKKDDTAALADAELIQRLADARDDLFKLRFRHVTGQLDNTAALGRARKEVARLMTAVRRREIAAAEATTGADA